MTTGTSQPLSGTLPMMSMEPMPFLPGSMTIDTGQPRAFMHSFSAKKPEGAAAVVTREAKGVLDPS
ncbi:MAG: hypothetical protein A2284_08970 [Deltaproteobacteria bacterium RIFOXYA12_FULL_61_11]|nr:MAG: hypothetical protein A2284_08970 [Deltaproteobacteria bacterium RIFOXYA12_FULL_61_11]